MVKTRFRLQDIKSYSPAVEVRSAGDNYSDDVYVLNGRNYVFDSKGPKSGFGTRLLAAGAVIGDPIGIAESIEIAKHCFVMVRKGIYELNDENTEWTQIYDLTTYQDIPFLPEKKWTAAYLSNGVYFCHVNHGLLKYTFDGVVELNQDTTPGLPFEPVAIAETNGRLIVLGRKYVGWSGPSAAEDFEPALGGAGEVLLSDRIPGEPLTLAAFQGGFLVWTDQGCLLAEFIGGDTVFRFTRVSTEQLPIDANCVENLPDGSQIICTKQGLYQIKNGQEPTKLVPIFNEFLRKVLDHEPAIHIRLTYQPEKDWLFVQVRDWTNHYVRTYVLSVALDKWGQFSDRHIGVIKWAARRGAYGYVDLEGVGHKFVDVFNREVTPHTFEGLDSSIIIGYIKPPRLHGEIDSLLEMQEIFLGGKARPSWSQAAEIDLGEVPPDPGDGCETLDQVPTLSVIPSQTEAQMTDNYNATNDGTDTWWDDISFPMPNLDTGEVFFYANKSYDYADPDYITNKTYLNVVGADGVSTQYYPGVFTDTAQSTTHYYIHDDVIAVDRHNGDLWAVHDWWDTNGSTLTRAVKANDYLFQDPMFPQTSDPFDGTEDTGLGNTGIMVGFTATDIILLHEVLADHDFKLEALNKDTFVRSSQCYIDSGVGDINGVIESGSYRSPLNFCMGPDNKVYHASWLSPASSPIAAYANGTIAFLKCYDPVAGTYTDITPWSDSALPITSDYIVAAGPNVTWGIKAMHYDRALDKIVIFFGGAAIDSTGGFDETLFGFGHPYMWSWGTYDTDSQAWVNKGQLPNSYWMDSNYDNCDQASAVWCQVGWAPMDYIKNFDSLPMASPCQELLHTMELVAPVTDGVIVYTDANDPAQLQFHICVRDPSQDFKVTQRFGVDEARYADLDAATGNGLSPQFLRSVIRGNSRPGNIEPFGQYWAGEMFRAYYLPSHKYLAYGSIAIDQVIFAETAYSPTWNNDDSTFYYMLEP